MSYDTAQAIQDQNMEIDELFRIDDEQGMDMVKKYKQEIATLRAQVATLRRRENDLLKRLETSQTLCSQCCREI